VSNITFNAVDHVMPRDKRLRLGLQIARLLLKGHLQLVLPDGSVHQYHGKEAGPSATMIVRNPRMVRRMVFGGSLGLAEAYLDGDWDSPNLADMLSLGPENEAAWEKILRGKAWARLAAVLAHKLRRNTRKGAKRNIAEHYDLGNDFYAHWLDRSMTYSAASFTHQNSSLETAQHEKIRRLCESLDLQPGMRVLEIGCGWGSFAEVAARDYGVHVTGVTLSRAQLEFARTRIVHAGLRDRVTLRLQDYRDVCGSFDRIASIEMFEAVGEDYWVDYFTALHDRLVPGGLAAVQVITIADRYFEQYRSSADFIQRYIFPGGMLPSPSRLAGEIAKAGLRLQEEFYFGLDYADTLARWQSAFQANWPLISQLDDQYDGRFKRLWEYYLAYCEAGFRAGWTDVTQVLIARPVP
jgi:cyclopropane-fatty-acyl-phospholipid synthase